MAVSNYPNFLMRTFHFAGIAALGLASALSVVAGTNGFTVPAFRGQPSSTFSGWENFTVAIGNPGNAGDLPGSSGDARLYQSAAGALVLGSGNIYNGEGASRFEIRYTGGTEPVEQVVLQARALGTELNYDSVKLFAWTESRVATRVELDRLTFGPPPPNPGSGVAVSSSWTWDIRDLNATSFAIALNANEVNLSFDSATLDVQLVPEPKAWVLLACGALALGLRRRSA